MKKEGCSLLTYTLRNKWNNL